MEEELIRPEEKKKIKESINEKSESRKDSLNELYELLNNSKDDITKQDSEIEHDIKVIDDLSLKEAINYLNIPDINKIEECSDISLDIPKKLYNFESNEEVVEENKEVMNEQQENDALLDNWVEIDDSYVDEWVLKLIEKNNKQPLKLQEIPVSMKSIISPLKTNLTVKSRFTGLKVPESSYFYKIVDEYVGAINMYYDSKAKVYKNFKILKSLLDDIWIEDKIIAAAIPGWCQDGVLITGEGIEIPNYIINLTIFTHIDKIKKKHMHLLYNLYGSDYFQLKLSQIRLEDFVLEYLNRSCYIGKVNKDEPIKIQNFQDIQPLDRLDIKETLSYVSVLFHFIRNVENNKNYTDDDCYTLTLYKLLRRLVSRLLRQSTIDEHLYILDELLHCKNISPWGLDFIQSIIHQNRVIMWNYVPSYLKMLALFLSPVIYQNPIDSSSEEYSIQLCEEDYLLLFKQFRCIDMLNHIFSFIEQDHIMGSTIQEELGNIFNFFENLLSILSNSLSSFSSYRSMSKRISQIIMKCMQILSKYCEILINKYNHMESIKSNIDQFIVYTFKMFVKNPNLWQFTTSIPFHILNISSSKYIFFSLINPNIIENSEYQSLSYEGWIKSQFSRSHFIDMLLSNSNSEFLFYGIAQLAISNHYNMDFVMIILHELFLISQVNQQTKELFSKSLMPAIGQIISTNITLFSFIIYLMNRYIDSLDIEIVKLLEYVPLKYFQPSHDELNILYDWLQTEKPLSPKLALSMNIIDRINWDYSKHTRELFLSKDIHIEASIIISKVSLLDQKGISHDLQQMRKKLYKWAEDRILLMKHRDFSGYRIHMPYSIDNPKISDLMETLSSAKNQINPVVAYTILQLSDIMDNIESIKEIGLPIIKKLIDQRKRRIVLRLIYDLIPHISKLLFKYPNKIEEIGVFKNICLPIIRSAPGLWNMTPEKNLDDYLSSLIIKQIDDVSTFSFIENGVILAKFWVSEIIKEPFWYTNESLCRFIDNIVKLYIYSFKSNEIVEYMISELNLNNLDKILSSLLKPKSNFIQRLVVWNQNLDKIQYPYLVYLLLLCFLLLIKRDIAEEFNETSQFFIFNKKFYNFVLQILSVIEDEHPIKLLFWQLFFVAYFRKSKDYNYGYEFFKLLKKRTYLKINSLNKVKSALNAMSHSSEMNKTVYDTLYKWTEIDINQITSYFDNEYVNYMDILFDVYNFTGMDNVWRMHIDREKIKMEIKNEEELWMKESEVVIKSYEQITNYQLHNNEFKMDYIEPIPLDELEEIKINPYTFRRNESIDLIKKGILLCSRYNSDIELKARQHNDAINAMLTLYRQKYKLTSENTSVLLKCSKNKNCSGAQIKLQYLINKLDENVSFKIDQLHKALERYQDPNEFITDELIMCFFKLEKTFIMKLDYIEQSIIGHLIELLQKARDTSTSLLHPTVHYYNFLINILRKRNIINE